MGVTIEPRETQASRGEGHPGHFPSACRSHQWPGGIVADRDELGVQVGAQDGHELKLVGRKEGC